MMTDSTLERLYARQDALRLTTGADDFLLKANYEDRLFESFEEAESEEQPEEDNYEWN